MKNYITTSLLLLLFACTTLLGQSNYQIESGEITIKGTSNIHDWESTNSAITVNGNFLTNDSQLKNIQQLKVVIPVKKIISSKGSIMDKKTWKALKYQDHPNITYTLTEIQSIENNGQNFLIKASGNLTIAGHTNPIELTATANFKTNRTIEIRGEKALKMTDFKVDPPTALLGTLTTGDDVTIEYNIVLTENSNISSAN